MLFKLFKKKKNWFTLIELLLVCSVFALLVSGVIIAINRAFSFMNDTKIRVRAANFAREGVEMMFNMRDTNWRKHSWERDVDWLCDGTENCADKLKEWLYTLKERTTDAGDTYFYAERLSHLYTTEEYDEFYGNSDWDRKFRTVAWDLNDDYWIKIQFNWDYNYMEYSDGNRVEQTGSIQDLLTSEVDFYRIVRVFGIYCKESSTSDNTNECPNPSDPKEMRFCVKVFYRYRDLNSSSELCSVMTNFME